MRTCLPQSPGERSALETPEYTRMVLAEIVHFVDFPADRLVEISDKAADNGAPQMAGVEGLRNVG